MKRIEKVKRKRIISEDDAKLSKKKKLFHKATEYFVKYHQGTYLTAYLIHMYLIHILYE